MFEEEVAEYCGSRYAVSLTSCTDAIFLCLKWFAYKSGNEMLNDEVIVPKKTYLSVPQSVIHAGGTPVFKDIKWSGIYRLDPYPIWDSAKRFTSAMYIPDSFMCLSFHTKKILKLNKGGMVLLNDPEAVAWLKKARYEGRSEKLYHDDDITSIGWNMYLEPEKAAHGLALMQQMPRHNDDLPEGNGYKDLTEFTVFKNYKTI